MAWVQAVLLLSAFYRGFRIPNFWSLAYYQVDWADGFIRRGLLGTLLLPLGCSRFDPHVIWAFQYAALAVTVACLLWLGRRGAAGLLLCLILLGDAGAFLFHEVGYPEQILLPLTLLCGVLLERRRNVAAAGILVACVLIHEMALFTVLPAAFFFWLRLDAGRRPSFGRLFGPALGVLAALAAASVPMQVPALQHFADQASSCGHPLQRLDFLIYYEETFLQQFTVYYHPSELVAVVLPLALGLALWILPGQAVLKAPWGQRWALLLACLAPLALGFLGTDKNRWIFLVLLQLLILVHPGTEAAAQEESGQGFFRRGLRLAWALPLILAVLATHIRMFDGYAARPYDGEGLKSLAAALQGQSQGTPQR
jgi:hypothetical protein